MNTASLKLYEMMDSYEMIKRHKGRRKEEKSEYRKKNIQQAQKNKCKWINYSSGFPSPRVSTP